MKKFSFTILLFSFIITLQAQVYKTVECTFGNLSTLLTAEEKNTVTNLTITGAIHACDFKTMRDDMPALAVLNISGATISAYSGTEGPAGLTPVDYPANEIPIYSFSGKINLTSIILPPSATSVGSYSFSHCTGLETVTFGSLCTSVGDYAFSDCTNLTGTIPSTITSFGSHAFNECTSLTGTLSFSSSLASLGDYAFYDCTGLSGTLTIPSSLDSIKDNAFCACTGLSSVVISSGVKSIGASAFNYCIGLAGAITIPSSVESIGNSAFQTCSNLSSVVLSEGVKSIGNNAFYACGGFIGSLALPSTLNSIGNAAFQECSGFTGILTIPSSVTSLGNNAFEDCSNFTGELTIPSSITSIGNSVFDGCFRISSVVITAGITAIGDNAFLHCNGLTGTLTIPTSVATIGAGAFKYCGHLASVSISSTVTAIGTGAFQYCSGLITVAESNLNYSSHEDVLFNETKSLLIQCPTSKTGNYTIPSTVTTIGYGAFSSCDNLTSVELPFGVTSIGDYAFYACTSLTSFTLPSTVISIGSFALNGCSGLRSFFARRSAPVDLSSSSSVFWGINPSKCILYVPNGATGLYDAAAQWTDFTHIVGTYFVTSTAGGLGSIIPLVDRSTLTNLTITGSIDARDFKFVRDVLPALSTLILRDVTVAAYSGTAGTAGTTSIDYPSNEIPDYAFFNPLTGTGKTSLTSVTLPLSISSIGDAAFYFCAGLTSIIIPEGVTSVGTAAFSFCLNLASATIPSTVTLIPSHLFTGCSSLSSMVIPSSIEAIGENAFESCIALDTIVIPSSVSTIADNAFIDCNGLDSLTLSEGVQIIGSGAFKDCNGLASVTIPSSVVSFGLGSFERCLGLSSITIKEGVTSIGLGIFQYCSNLASAKIPSSVEIIEESAFMFCTNLSSIEIVEGVQSIGRNAFSYCTNLTSVTIPPSVTSIGDNAFNNCDGLLSITIPPSVNSIGNSVFFGCINLASIQAQSTTPVDISSSLNVFYDVNKTTCILYVPYGTALRYDAAEQWTDFLNISAAPNGFLLDSNTATHDKEAGTTNVGLIANVEWTKTSSDDWWLGVSPTTGTTDATLTITAAENRLWIRTGIITVSAEGYNDQSITFTQAGITIATVYLSEMGLSSYIPDADKPLITELTITGTIDARDFFTMRDDMPALKKIDLSEATIVAFSGKVVSGVAKDEPLFVKIGTGYPANEVPQNAFSDRSGLTSVILPSSITSIARYAFRNCSGLTSIDIPSTVLSIGESAFSGCSGLSSINAHPIYPVDISSSPNVFFDVNTTTCNLYVPLDSKSDYEAANQWQDFMNIIEFQSPVANAGIDQEVFEDSLVTLDGTASYDPDDNPLTYLWKVPDGLKLSSDTVSKPTFTALKVLKDSSLIFSLVVNNGFTDSREDTVVITIKKKPVTPIDFSLSDTIFGSGTFECFGAIQDITVAESGTKVDFESGSSVNFIAGNSIRFLPGFFAHSGSSMHATITTDGTFCELAPLSPIANLPVEKSIEDETSPIALPILPNEKSIKVYPNPNNGQFTLELTNIESGATVCIYNMLGARIYQSSATNEESRKIHLQGIRRGIYFVKVIDGKEQFTRKMVVN